MSIVHLYLLINVIRGKRNTKQCVIVVFFQINGNSITENCVFDKMINRV